MADQGEGRDSCNLEIHECREPHLEATQDLELLAQEIAEAAVEDERRSSGTPSPPPPRPPLDEVEAAERADPDEATDGGSEGEGESNLTHVDEEDTCESLRSNSPVDEASWVLVDAADGDQDKTDCPEQKFNVYRKFLARGDLLQKLTDLGLSCDAYPQDPSPASASQQGGLSLQDLMVSCSESMVICNLPQESDGEDDGTIRQVFLKDDPDSPGMPGWRGTISGGKVTVEVERQGGLLVAAVSVWHRDLLSALTSLRNLVSSAGLVSYADVDVPSLLARAA